ncbi:MAG TPA: hypothetical protein VNU28_03980, partial [Solirubrobacteraceae bacterium]|nr:hypothetical protein [Solirubrobacteraceae bacterium]
VAETLGQALLTIAMMAGGLWMIADPLGTVGAVGQFANDASLGTLGATAQGTTANAPRTLGDSLRALFAGTIELPWCYLEFGNVRWCSDPAALEPRLRRAALSIVASGQTKLACQTSPAGRPCQSSGETSALTAEHTSQLVREADTNGALFLAFPANLPERNSVKGSSSLLHVLCQSEDDTKCEGSTAAQAEFRSDSGTFPRMIGVVLIAVGVLGMAILFGLLAVHLLASAILSMFMLLLAPFAVLAPALGDAGRAFFTGWLTRMLGAVSSKLIFSFLLGVLLTMQRMLASLEPLGWWTQWLLISAFWWVVFLKRHQALAFVQRGGRAPAAAPTRQTLGRRIEGTRQAKRDIAHPVRWTKNKLLPPLPADEELRKRDRRGQGPGGQIGGRPEGRRKAGEGPQHEGRAGQDGGHAQREQWTKRSELADAPERTGRAGEQSEQTGGPAARTQRVEAHSAGAQSPGADASSAAPRRGGGSHRAHDPASKPSRLERAARLAAYASEPEFAEAAWLASARQSQSQLQLPAPRQLPPQRRSQSPGAQAPGNAGASPSHSTRAASEPHTPSVPVPRAADSQETRMRTSSEIMDDAREVAARHRRQLGLESPAADELDP